MKTERVDSIDSTAVSEVPAKYDAWYDTPVGQATLTTELALLRKAAGVAAHGDILEVGSGTGRFLIAMAQNASRAVGIDIQEPMVEYLRRRIQEERLQIELYHADARQLPFADDIFDLVYENTMLSDLQNPHAAIAEMARVTRPGGRVVLGELTPSPWYWARKLWAGIAGGAFQHRNAHRPQFLRATLAKHVRVTFQERGVFFPPINFSVQSLLALERLGSRLWPCGGAYVIMAGVKEPVRRKAPGLAPLSS